MRASRHRTQFWARHMRLARSAALAAWIGTVATGIAIGQEPAQPPPVAAPKHAQANPGNAWAPFALVGIAITLGVAAVLMFISAKQRPERRKKAQFTRRHENPPAEIPVLTPVAVDATAICELARTHVDTCPPLPEPEPDIAPPDPSLDTAISTCIEQAPLPLLADDGLTLPASSGPLSRGATIACGRCKRLIPAELGIPPWCPHCGTDFKANVDHPPSLNIDRTTGEVRNLQPPYFIARLGRSYRVYVLPSKLLFLEAPGPNDMSRAERMVRGMPAGLLGWVIGTAIAAASGDFRRMTAHNRRVLLDLAEPPALVEMAEREYASFRVDIDDLGATRIEGLSFWQCLITERCAGQFHFTHPERGPVVADLPSPDDMRVAIKQLKAVLGDKLTINAIWDHDKERFVPQSAPAV